MFLRCDTCLDLLVYSETMFQYRRGFIMTAHHLYRCVYCLEPMFDHGYHIQLYDITVRNYLLPNHYRDLWVYSAAYGISLFPERNYDDRPQCFTQQSSVYVSRYR
jgi:hypothetical protein